MLDPGPEGTEGGPACSRGPTRRGALRAFGSAAAAGWLASCRKLPASAVGRLTLSLPYQVDTLDPHARNWASSFAIASSFYEPLVTRDRELALVPCLADRWSNPAPDTWRFQLRRDVLFHSGSPLASKDVVFSLERLLARPELEISTYAQRIASVRAVDSLTVEIRTHTPSAILLNDLRFLLIVPAGKEPASDVSGVDGTGPYRPVAWRPGERIEMARQAGHRGPPPAFDDVTILLGRSPDQAVEDLLAGRSDLVQANFRDLEQRLRRPDGLVVRRQTSVFTKYLGFDVGRDVTPFVEGPNPFRDPRVRQAVDLGIDREALTVALTSSAVAAKDLVPPLVVGHDPAVPLPRADAERARSLLRAAGFGAGFAVTLHTRRPLAEAAERVSTMLGSLAIRSRVEALDDVEFFRRMRTRDFSLFLTRLGCVTGDADIFLRQVVLSRDPRRPTHMSDTGLADPELDRLVEESGRLLEMDRRHQALRQVLARVREMRVVLPLQVDQDVFAFRDRLAFSPRADSYVLPAEITLAG